MAKSCERCGQEMPDEARFCMRCGRSFVDMEDPKKVAAARVREGHWEYHTFEKDLGGASFWLNGWAIDGSGPSDRNFRAFIDEAGRQLMEEVAKDGWQPREPVNYRSLWMNSRVNFTAKSSILRSGTGYTLHSLKLECQRWVTDEENV